VITSDAITHKAVYFTGMLEYHGQYNENNRQLFYNAIVWTQLPPYEHELAVSLEAPNLLPPGGSLMLNATVYNIGLSNETDVELQILINDTVVQSNTIPELLAGGSYTLSHLWTPTIEGIYNVTAYAPPVLNESLITNNVMSKMVRVRYVPVALISDQSQLLAITPILDSMGIGYDIYNDNSIHLYTENLNLLLSYQIVIFNNYNREITSSEHTALQSYLSSGGNLLVTGYDSLGSPDDWLLADIVRSSSVGDNTGEPDLYVVDETHPIMNGPYGSFPAGYHISGLYSDCDAAEADTGRNAITVAELWDGYDKIIATELSPGRVVYWNGEGTYDWIWNVDCEVMLKNMLAWLGIRYEHELTVSLDAPEFLEPGDSSLLNATVRNRGLSNETNVELQLLINGTIVNSTIISELLIGESCKLSHLWTPMVEGIYNVTAYAPPVTGEEFMANNVATKMVMVRYPPKLLVVDTPAPEDTGALDKLGYEYTLVSPTEFATVDLYEFNVLFVGWVPGDEVVNALLSRASEIAEWVAAGNGIVALSEPSESNRWAWLPLWVMSDGYGGENVHILDPTHPVMFNLTDAELSYWGTSYHGCFYSYHADWTALAQGIEAGYPITLAATYGAGKIAITHQDPDYHFYYNDVQGARKLLRNMIEWATSMIQYEHDLAVSLAVPASLKLGDSTMIKATVKNRGLNNETDVELYLLINGTVVNSATIPELLVGESYTITYLWTPTIIATYNITAYAPPVTGEEFTANNVVIRSVNVWLVPVIGTSIFIDPLETTVMLGQNFTVSVNVANVTNLAGWQLNVTFNPAILNVNRIFLPHGHIFEGLDPITPTTWIDNTAGYVEWLCAIGPAAPIDHFNGSGTMCQIEFATVGLGTSSLHIDTEGVFCTLLVDPDANDISFTPIDGNANVVEYVPVHDIAIIDVTPSVTEAYAGWTVNISVVAKNEGEFTETFNVTAYYDTSPIETRPVSNLAPGTNVTITFALNTSGVQPYVNYTIWAEASIVPGETDTADNTFTDGTVKIKLMGDVNSDGKVDIKDLVLLVKAFGSFPGHPRWNPDTDLNNDNKVDIRDLVLLLKNYGIIP
jgi:archaellum component FlaF (FlaF/FlaG flagellin family)